MYLRLFPETNDIAAQHFLQIPFTPVLPLLSDVSPVGSFRDNEQWYKGWYVFFDRQTEVLPNSEIQ